MNKKYVIQWKSKVNGRAGKGTKLFDREEADRLVRELNYEYPQIEHHVVLAEHESETLGTVSHEESEPSAPVELAAAR